MKTKIKTTNALCGLLSALLLLAAGTLTPAHAQTIGTVAGKGSGSFSGEGGTPTLGNYPDTSVPLSGDTTVTPDAAPTNTTSINVSTSTDFDGTFAADPMTGIVMVTDAHPAGMYTVTVKAFGPGGTTTKTFMLTVTSTLCGAGFTVGFTNATDVNVGSNPPSVAIGDFNGDGEQDLAVVNVNSHTVSIRLGDGVGGFGGSTDVGVGFNPQSVAIGDFNGDGKQDLAVANFSSNTVSIRLGDGLGGFSGSTEVSVSNPQSVAIGDFNRDGKQDLAVANYFSDTVSIRLGDGLGGFSGSPNVSVGSSPVSVAIGDFNRDGAQDLAVVNAGSGTVSIKLGDGLGGFSGLTEVPVGAAPLSVAIGNFNGDGDQDLAVANRDFNTVSIRLGDGFGGFSGSTDVSVGSSPVSVAIGDFNGDGKQDLAVANDGSNTVSIRLGNGMGGFSGSSNVSVGFTPRSVAIGDFNADGKQDLAVANFSSNTVSIRLGGCMPVATNTQDSGPGSLREALANAQDGDVITFNFGGNGSNVRGALNVPMFIITLTTSELVINTNVTIMGLGANVLEMTRDPNAANFRIFHVVPGKTVTISGLTISNGQDDGVGGGGIYNNHSVLTVTGCALNGNHAGFVGGGLYNDGSFNGTATLAVINSTLTANGAPHGGGIFNDAFSAGSATLSVNNSTLSGNTQGRGIGNQTGGGITTITVANSTFVDNTGGNISSLDGGSLDIGNTILDSCPAAGNIFGFTVVTSHGYNLSSDNGGGFLTAAGDQINTDPMLAPLQDNGGPTLTHAPVVNSPAVDQGKRDTILTLSTNFDQRGSVRPVDDPAVTDAAGGDASDIGAVELGEFVHPISAASRKTHGPAGDFDVDLPFVNFANSPIGIECRTGGATGLYTVIMNFPGNVSFTSAAVTSCGTTGSVSTASGSGTNQATINLTGVTDVQTLTLALFDVDDGTNVSNVGVRVRMRIGDVTASGAVNSSDVSSVKLELGQPVDGMNFRNDVRANGDINSSDVTLTKSKIQ